MIVLRLFGSLDVSLVFYWSGFYVRHHKDTGLCETSGSVGSSRDQPRVLPYTVHHRSMVCFLWSRHIPLLDRNIIVLNLEAAIIATMV